MGMIKWWMAIFSNRSNHIVAVCELSVIHYSGSHDTKHHSLTDVMGSSPPHPLDVDICMLMYSNVGALPYLYNYTHLTQGVSHSEVSQSLSNLIHHLLHHILLYNETTTSTTYSASSFEMPLTCFSHKTISIRS